MIYSFRRHEIKFEKFNGGFNKVIWTMVFLGSRALLCNRIFCGKVMENLAVFSAVKNFTFAWPLFLEDNGFLGSLRALLCNRIFAEKSMDILAVLHNENFSYLVQPLSLRESAKVRLLWFYRQVFGRGGVLESFSLFFSTEEEKVQWTSFLLELRFSKCTGNPWQSPFD